MKIQKIIITGDFLRVDRNGRFCQYGNIKWLRNLLSPLLSILTQKEIIYEVYGDSTGTGDNIAEKFYAARGDIPTLDAWVKTYNADCNIRQLALLYSYFSNSLVIAFEMPDIVARGLTTLGIPFIDLTIHPVRFMRELPFGVRSNIENVQQDFLCWKIPEENIFIEAGAAQAALSRLPRIRDCQEGDNIGLFACQTSADRVLIQRDQLLSVEDFIKEFTAIANSHKILLIKPHPYEVNSDIASFFTQLFPNTKIIKDNFYHIISHENISAVYSITSSATIEAKYFGKKSIHIGNYPYKFTASNVGIDAYMTIRPCFLYPEFWLPIFDRVGLKAQDPQIPPVPVDIRKSLNSYWGADILFK